MIWVTSWIRHPLVQHLKHACLIFAHHLQLHSQAMGYGPVDSWSYHKLLPRKPSWIIAAWKRQKKQHLYCNTRSILVLLAEADKQRFSRVFKALANKDTLLRTHCCRHKCFPVCPLAQHLLRTQILCPGHKKCFWFCSETFCVQFAQPKKHHGRQRVRNNVSSFTRAFRLSYFYNRNWEL